MTLYFFFFLFYIKLVKTDISNTLNSVNQPLIKAASNYITSLENYFQNNSYSNPDKCNLYLGKNGFYTKCDSSFPTPAYCIDSCSSFKISYSNIQNGLMVG
jgi:hypothetical protein